MTDEKPRILYVTSSLPSLTLTFIYREINALEKLGVPIDIVSMNRPKFENVSIEARPLLDRILFLDQVPKFRLLASTVVTLLTRPGRFISTLGKLFKAKPRRGMRDFSRLTYHFVEAAFLHRAINTQKYFHIHAHFVSGPSSIAMFLSGFSKIPFSFTMHGGQIYIDPIGLETKLNECQFAVSISEFHRRFALDEYGDGLNRKLHVVRCGLQLDEFPQPERRVANQDVFRILGVGRLVEVKGFEFLLRACAELAKRRVNFVCQIVGDGELRDRLEQISTDLGTNDYVHFEGAKIQSELPDYFSKASAFCLPCVIAADGCMDGLPVVLMEAMAWELPVVSSKLVGIPELVESHKHGILVEPENVSGLAEALIYIHDNQEKALEWGQLGREKVATAFNVDIAAKQLKKLFYSGTNDKLEAADSA